MKVLILCNKSPYPPKEGGSLAMYNIIRGLLKQGFKVKVLAIDTLKFPIDTNNMPSEFVEKTQFESVFIHTNPSITGAIKNIFSNRSYHIERFYSSRFAEKLAAVLKSDTFDVIQLESLYMMPYMGIIRTHSNAKTVLRAHNIEHIIWERICGGTHNIFKKAYLKIQTKRLRKYELSHLSTCDGIAAISSVDADFIKAHDSDLQVCTIPFGIDNTIVNEASETVKEPKSIFFLGSLNWLPNLEGLEWFLQNVWPAVIHKNKQLNFYIAGRHTPENLNKLKQENVQVVGEVEDALAFMRSKAVMIVPLFSGSGMRIKIIEGMFAGNTVISTSVGAEGIDYTHGKDILIADTAVAFTEAILNCTGNDLLIKETGLNAQKLVNEKYLNDNIINKLVLFYKKIKGI